MAISIVTTDACISMTVSSNPDVARATCLPTIQLISAKEGAAKHNEIENRPKIIFEPIALRLSAMVAGDKFNQWNSARKIKTPAESPDI